MHRLHGRAEQLSFGAGDSHRGGSTVAIVRGEGWRVVYKPRSLAIDSALRGFVAELVGDHGSALNVGVPKVMDCGDYGWVEFMTHRFAAGNEELLSFYRGIGHLLALMRLLSGTDLHAENVIAQGGTPVVVDCETLFTPKIPASPSGYGGAFDRAAELIARTVLSVGVLPGRGMGLDGAVLILPRWACCRDSSRCSSSRESLTLVRTKRMSAHPF